MLRLLILGICLLLVGPAQAARGILGAQSYDAPIGCTPDSVFNLTAGTILNTFASASGATTSQTFEIVPNYNNGQGAAFQMLLNGATNLVMATSGLRPSSYFGSLQFSTANNPDTTAGFASIANIGDSTIFVHNSNVVGACLAANCLHNYIWSTSGAGPGIDTDFIGPTTVVSTFSEGVFDGLSYYFLHRRAVPGTINVLWKYDNTGTNLEATQNLGTFNNRSDMTQDDSYVYFVNTTGNKVVRATKDNGLTITDFAITPTTVSGNITYSRIQNAFYIITVDGGSSVHVRRYNTDFSTNTHTNTVGIETVVAKSLLMDERAQKLYLVTEVPATTIVRIRRLNPSTLATEQTLSIDRGTNNFVPASDFDYKNLWISDVGNPSHIQRIGLCS